MNQQKKSILPTMFKHTLKNKIENLNKRYGWKTLVVIILFATCLVSCTFIYKSGLSSKQKELDEVIKKIDIELYEQCEKDVRAWLDARMLEQRLGLWESTRIKFKSDGSVRARFKNGHIGGYGSVFLRAYEILGDEKYLDVALKTCDFLLKTQNSRGFWNYNYNMSADGEKFTLSDQNTMSEGCMRSQDRHQSSAFAFMLYAWRLTGDNRYFESAKRNADALLSAQHGNGSWGDYWDFDLAKEGEKNKHTDGNGTIWGCSFNDGSTRLPLIQMMTMYHLTGDNKYLAKFDKFGQWLFDSQVGEGDVRGWAHQYNKEGKPTHARQHEPAAIDPRVFNRSTSKFLTLFYLLTGEERYVKLIRETYDWLDNVKHPTGWAECYLPDGTPIFSYNWKIYHVNKPDSWPTDKEFIEKFKRAPFSLNKYGPESISSLLENIEGIDAKKIRNNLSGPMDLTPEQYLDARINAAQEALDEGLIAKASKRGMVKGEKNGSRLHGKMGFPIGGVNQWTYLRAVHLALGEISPKLAAPGGQSFNLIDKEFINAVKIPNWFDLPIGKLK